MRKIVIFYTFLYLTFYKANAVPLLGVVPFVYDIGIFLFVFLMGITNITFFYILRKTDYLYYFIYTIFIGINLYIIYLIGLRNFFGINLDMYYFTYKYIYVVFISIIGISLSIIFYKKSYIILSLIFLVSVPIPFGYNILSDTIKLKDEFDALIISLNKKTNNSVTFNKLLLYNNIIISRDIQYEYEGKINKCRVSFSFYHNGSISKRVSKTGSRKKQIQLYLGLNDSDKCLSLIKNILKI